MKKYVKPQLNDILFVVEDILTTSAEDGEDTQYTFLKTSVGGKEGVDYGAQSVSVIDDQSGEDFMKKLILSLMVIVGLMSTNVYANEITVLVN